MALKAGRVGVAPTEVTIDGKIKGGSASVPDATTTSKGIVQIGSGLAVASGIASVAVATNTAAGGLYVSFDTATATLNLSTTPITEGGE